MSEIGLFPLPIVLLPDERVPLHIFEPRYKELIGECVEDERDFGLVLADDRGMRSVGTRAAVVQVLRRYPDGRLDIVVEGRRRLSVVELTEGRSFMTAEVMDLDDEDDMPTKEEIRRCIEALAGFLASSGGPPPNAHSGRLSFEIAARASLPPRVKQELLEMTSERARLARLQAVFAEAASGALRRSAIAERATGNGHVASDE